MKIRIGIDASRCSSGGAIEHFRNVFYNSTSKNPDVEYFCWVAEEGYESSCKDQFELLRAMPDNPIIIQIFWQFLALPLLLKYYKIDLLFTLDTASACLFKPQISLHQDLLAFEKYSEALKSLTLQEKIRLWFVKKFSIVNMMRSEKLIFLTHYARKLITQKYSFQKKSVIIPHSCDKAYLDINQPCQLRNQDAKLTFTYVSHYSFYKHQRELITALYQLSMNIIDIELNLIGSGFDDIKVRRSLLDGISFGNTFKINFMGFCTKKEIIDKYNESSILVFASSCEAFGMTLIEKMASSVPLACSNKSCLPELVGSNYPYSFDPTSSKSIEFTLKTMINDFGLCKKVGIKNRARAREFRWSKISSSYHELIYQSAKEFSRSQ